MNEEIIINKSLSDDEIYRSLLPQIEALINPNEPVISAMANVSAALNQAFQKISWAGFYIRKDSRLFLGPFQGKVACTVIDIGSGVCGRAAKSGETIIVPDVEKFPGHIACDSGSRSEIVVPIFANGFLSAVLDLDSYLQNAFNESDKLHLEKITKLIGSVWEAKNFSLTF